MPETRRAESAKDCRSDPSTTVSSIAATVTVCGVAQLVESKVSRRSPLARRVWLTPATKRT